MERIIRLKFFRYLAGLVGALCGGCFFFCVIQLQEISGLDVILYVLFFDLAALIAFAVFGAITGYALTIYLQGEPNKRLNVVSVAGFIGVISSCLIFDKWIDLNRPTTPTYPSDSELTKMFKAHRSDFELLATMFKQDKHLIWVEKPDADPAEPWDADLSANRKQEYHRLFVRIGAKKESFADFDGKFCLVLWSYVGESEQSVSGFEFAPGPIKDCKGDSASCSIEGDLQTSTYRRVSGPWYLYSFLGGD